MHPSWGQHGKKICWMCSFFFWLQVIHVLDMTSAQLHSLVLGAEENLHSLQLRLETHTQSHISPLSQELLLETGISLDPRRPPSHCLPEGLVCDTHAHKQKTSNVKQAQPNVHRQHKTSCFFCLHNWRILFLFSNFWLLLLLLLFFVFSRHF